MRKLVLCLIVLFYTSRNGAYAEDMHHTGMASPDSVAHVSITLQEGIIPELPVVNQPLSLDEAIAFGLKNSLPVQIAQTETRIQNASFHEALAERIPTINLGSNTFVRAGNNQTLMTPDMMMTTTDATVLQDLNASARFPLFTGGRLRAGIRATRFALGASQSAVNQAMAETAFQIRASYLKVLLSQSKHAVHQDHIQLQNALLKNTQARYRVGRGLKADVLRIQTDLADTQRMLNEEHNELNVALFDLKASMGTDLASQITLTDRLTFTPWTGPDLNTLLQESITRHPKLIQLQKQAQEAEARVHVAKSEYYPQVRGQVTGNLRFPNNPPMMGNGVIGLLSTSLPLFDRTRNARVEQAKMTLLKVQQQLRAEQLTIAKEIAQAWSGLKFSEGNIALSESAVSQAQEDLRLIQSRYQVGRAVLVEVQDASLALRQAQLNQIQAIYNYKLAEAKLLKALGRINNQQP